MCARLCVSQSVEPNGAGILWSSNIRRFCNVYLLGLLPFLGKLSKFIGHIIGNGRLFGWGLFKNASKSIFSPLFERMYERSAAEYKVGCMHIHITHVWVVKLIQRKQLNMKSWTGTAKKSERIFGIILTHRSPTTTTVCRAAFIVYIRHFRHVCIVYNFYSQLTLH